MSTMPRYFFNRQGGSVAKDSEGTEFQNIAEARRAAIMFAGETLRDLPDAVCAGKGLQVEVTDESGEALIVVDIAVSGPR